MNGKLICRKLRSLQNATEDILERAVVINLDTRKDRWLKVRRSFSKAGLKTCIRFSANDGCNLDLERDIRVRRVALPGPNKLRQDHRDLSIGGIGCFLSHISLWETLLNYTDAREVVVFEDDAVPSTFFRELSPEGRRGVLEKSPPDAGLILLGCNVIQGASCPSPQPGLSRVFYFNSTHAYVIRRRAIEALLPVVFPIRAHIDHQISDVLMFHPNKLSAYALDNPWFEHDWNSRSDVDSPIETVEADRRLASYVERGKRRLREKYGIQCF